MSTGYTKLFNSILHSTVWGEDHTTRILWITMLAMCDKHGAVNAAVPGLARAANITMAETEAALKKFLAPDPYSRTPDFEGRRIQAIDGGWVLLNHGKYRSMMSAEERKEYNRQKQAEHRARQKASNGVIDNQSQSAKSAHTDTDTDTDTEAKSKKKTTLSAGADALSLGNGKQPCNGKIYESPTTKTMKSSSTPITSDASSCASSCTGIQPEGTRTDVSMKITTSTNANGSQPASKPPSQCDKLWTVWKESKAFRRDNRGALERAFTVQSKAKDFDFDKVLEATKAYVVSREGLGQFCKGPGPWMNAKKWDDPRENWDRPQETNGPAPPVQKSRVMLSVGELVARGLIPGEVPEPTVVYDAFGSERRGGNDGS